MAKAPIIRHCERCHTPYIDNPVSKAYHEGDQCQPYSTFKAYKKRKKAMQWMKSKNGKTEA